MKAPVVFLIFLAVSPHVFSGENVGAKRDAVFLIDLPAALQLAGAQNLDIQLAREKVNEAQAHRESAVEKFFPWINAGVAYRGHSHLIQDVTGNIIDVSKQSYAPGGTLSAQTDLGDALFKSLEARQLLRASSHALDAQHDGTIVAAAHGYLDLVKATSAANVAREAVRISDDYEKQIRRAVEAGIAFKGDALRVKVQSGRNGLLLRQAEESAQIAAAKLVQILHLEPGVVLAPRDSDPPRLSLVSAKAPSVELIARAFASRPEMKQNTALVLAARDAKNGAVYGPLLPTIGGQAYIGGLGGGRPGNTRGLGESEDYTASLNWRIGPGGLFDFGNVHAQQSRLHGAEIGAEKIRDQIAFEVVAARARVLSLADQFVVAHQALADAAEVHKLDEARKEFGVGVVLETITAEQDLTRARNEFLGIVADYDKAQFTLLHALGALEKPRLQKGKLRAEEKFR